MDSKNTIIDETTLNNIHGLLSLHYKVHRGKGKRGKGTQFKRGKGRKYKEGKRRKVEREKEEQEKKL